MNGNLDREPKSNILVVESYKNSATKKYWMTGVSVATKQQKQRAKLKRKTRQDIMWEKTTMLKCSTTMDKLGWSPWDVSLDESLPKWLNEAEASWDGDAVLNW